MVRGQVAVRATKSKFGATLSPKEFAIVSNYLKKRQGYVAEFKRFFEFFCDFLSFES